MNNLVRYTDSVEPMLQAIEKTDSIKLLRQVESEVNAVSTQTAGAMIDNLTLTLRRIVSARKELALQANGIKPLLATLKKRR